MTTTIADSSLDLGLLRLMQLSSPSFPVGAFAYSQGLEGAIHNEWVTDAGSAVDWIRGLLNQTLATLDVPILSRAITAWAAGDLSRVQSLSALQLACREARELQEEDLQLGRALLRALGNLGVTQALDAPGDTTYCVAFGLAAHHFGIDVSRAATGYLYAWCDNQVIAASRLIPLGQSQAQQVLSACLLTIPSAVTRGLSLADGDLGLTAPGLGLASAQHETQYARLFRS
jgi:urease accessory protein